MAPARPLRGLLPEGAGMALDLAEEELSPMAISGSVAKAVVCRPGSGGTAGRVSH